MNNIKRQKYTALKDEPSGWKLKPNQLLGKIREIAPERMERPAKGNYAQVWMRLVVKVSPYPDFTPVCTPPTTNAKETEVDQVYEDLQDL